jgi:hypothetical protein
MVSHFGGRGHFEFDSTIVNVDGPVAQLDRALPSHGEVGGSSPSGATPF